MADLIIMVLFTLVCYFSTAHFFIFSPSGQVISVYFCGQCFHCWFSLKTLRCQELRNSPFWPSSLFNSQLVKECEDFLLNKGTSKDAQGFRPYQNKPFRGPDNKKRGSYRKRPCGGNSSQSSKQLFSSGRETKFQRLQGSFLTPPQGTRVWKPLPPNDSLKASLSPPIGGWKINKCSDSVLNIITNGYILPFISKPKLV